MAKRSKYLSIVFTAACWANFAYSLIANYRLFGPILIVGAATTILVLANLFLALGAAKRSQSAMNVKRDRALETTNAG